MSKENQYLSELQEKTTKKVVEIAEKLNFSVYESINSHGTVELELSKYSPCGQDFSISLSVKKDNTLEDLHSEVQSMYDCYDPDYEASLWIGDDGHGTNGAPYHIGDIVKDMEACDEYFREFAEHSDWHE